MSQKPGKKTLVIVAHPDDETLWTGGTLLSNPAWDSFVICLCRANDQDRAPRFHKALVALGAAGVMGDLDDGPEQSPLSPALVEAEILKLLPPARFELTITHSPKGEYTRHLRHEETGAAVIELWNKGTLPTDTLWIFAYEDHDRAHLPRAIEQEAAPYELPPAVWTRKHDIMTQIYGFAPDSWEARATPQAEAFWKFRHAEQARDKFPPAGKTSTRTRP